MTFNVMKKIENFQEHYFICSTFNKIVQKIIKWVLKAYFKVNETRTLVVRSFTCITLPLKN